MAKEKVLEVRQAVLDLGLGKMWIIACSRNCEFKHGRMSHVRDMSEKVGLEHGEGGEKVREMGKHVSCSRFLEE